MKGPRDVTLVIGAIALAIGFILIKVAQIIKNRQEDVS